jgi:hypothetical protein
MESGLTQHHKLKGRRSVALSISWKKLDYLINPQLLKQLMRTRSGSAVARQDRIYQRF